MIFGPVPYLNLAAIVAMVICLTEVVTFYMHCSLKYILSMTNLLFNIFTLRPFAIKELLEQFGIRSVVPFTLEEQSVLNDQFDRNPYPSKEERERIATHMGHPFKKIDNWFLQKRFKMNKARNSRK